MSILSDAWRRARGEEDSVTRALGAPPPQPGARRAHWLPWFISCLLLIVVVGLSVYLWRTHQLASSSMQAARTEAAKAPVKPTVAAVQAGIKSPAGSQASHAVAAIHTRMSANAASVPVAPAVTRTADTAAPGTAPEAVRAQLPSLEVTIHVWNPHPASRFIMASGRIYHEGDQISPGLSLVSITPDGEIVKFRGYLITLGNH